MHQTVHFLNARSPRPPHASPAMASCLLSADAGKVVDTWARIVKQKELCWLLVMIDVTNAAYREVL